ncbi:VOC family protein [Streptomyces orinoci]|uniref:VOC family protein n=1 Tax=Streptomyces orinoci TaxID=67339 RepID=A0ABV3K5G3_STRON|nr:VOC family protein [Streptomyces orinoci]
MKQKITTFLWFTDQAEEAAEFYVSVFGGDSRIVDKTLYTEDSPGKPGTVMTVVFELAGQQFVALNGGDRGFTFNEAVSLSVDCDGQEEVDRFWSALTADGGQEGPCAWLKDKYGLSWQIVPRQLPEILGGPDKEGAARAMQAMLGMKKIDVQGLRSAYEGE